jgi:hypothetical protein
LKFRKKWIGFRKRLGNRKDPNINYFNFSARVVDDDVFKQLVWSQLSDLDQRKILPEAINPLKLWKDHQDRIQDHGKIIQGLASLEIHLKAGKKL